MILTWRCEFVTYHFAPIYARYRSQNRRKESSYICLVRSASNPRMGEVTSHSQHHTQLHADGRDKRIYRVYFF